MKRCVTYGALAASLALASCDVGPEPTGPAGVGDALFSAGADGAEVIGINIVLSRPATPAILQDLADYGAVTGQIEEIRAVFLRGERDALAAIRGRPYVESAGPDAERFGAPIDPLQAESFTIGLSTWNLDAVGVTESPLSVSRAVPYDGSGVYVGVLDTGLLDTWRQYFPEERIAEEYAASFSGSGALGGGTVSEQPNKWEHDNNSHGTHVTSTILGYSLDGLPINGVAPGATVIPVKVLNQNGSGWSSVVAMGIMHIARLKAEQLANVPVVINMSLGGSRLDPVEKAAIDHAIASGVVIVAAAGNGGTNGMAYPGAYSPVISVAAAGWTGQWLPHEVDGVEFGFRSWWVAGDIAEPTDADDFYIVDFSSRALSGQDLDVTAPGSWVVGPYQLQSGKTSYFFLSGTSMASPHVAGIVALMAQQNPSLTADQAEATLESTAIPLPPGSRDVVSPAGTSVHFAWEADATGAGLVSAAAALGLVSEEPHGNGNGRGPKRK